MSGSPAPQAFPRELVLASAGSGKTYHLSNRILGLLSAGAPPGSMLASTFTRKAAGEILERVLVRLAEGACDAAKARELGREAHPILTEPDECRRILARLLTDLNEMNVGTLDAFFVRVARSFFQELGLAPRWTIADEPTQDRLRTDAVQAALQAADGAEMVELLCMLNRDGADRRVHATLLGKVDDLLGVRRQLDPTAVDPWRPGFGVTEQFSPEALRDNAQTLAAHLRELEVPSTKSGSPMKVWATARDHAADAISVLDWGKAFRTGVGVKVLAGEHSFSSHPIPPEFEDVLLEAKRLARIDLAPKLRRETQALGHLAELLDTAFSRTQRRAGAYRFDDITYLLGGPDPTGSRDDLSYRLDQQVRHLLLDEFQDTSSEQWRALEPLAHELLSGHLDERAGVIVADPKQSIYGWRGARPELVRRVGEAHGLAVDTMDTSWRSGSVILDFVADVFRGLAANPVVQKIDGGPEVASAWMQDFTELDAARDLPGHVCVHVAPGDSGWAAIQPGLLRRAALVVKELHEQIPDRSIGVLASRNRVVGHLMDELRDAGVRASGEGGVYLTDTPPVNALLSLLRLADHPSDPSALYHVAQTPVGEIVGLQDREDTGAARAVASRVRIQLHTDGYGPTLAGWVHDLASRCDAIEVQRLLQLVELGHRWDQRATLRPTDFTRYVAREAVEDPSSAQVQVMTVHRSKGLEFDAVVLPELYASLAHEGGGVLIPERDPSTGLVTRVYPAMPKEYRAFFPEVEAADRELRMAELRDGLSVLYVAITRAKHALHLILPPEGGRARHSAALIRGALKLDDEKASDAHVLLERGDPRWFDRLEDEAGSVDEARPVDEREPPEEADFGAPLFRPSATRRGRNLARRSPSSLEGGDQVDLSLTLRLDAAPALQRGELVHAWCSKIEWIKDWVGDPDELRAIARATALEMPEDQVADLIAEFHGWMEAEPIRSALSRDGLPSDLFTVLRVENELPFVRRVGDEIQEGVIDRLVLVERDGRVVQAEILDFKTDSVESGDDEALAAYAERYRPQIVAYCEVVREQYGLAEGDVVGWLVFLGAGVIRKVA
jgi:ATP-dependent helicase/nuclease subunit A